ncbi:hypothetical protein C5L31_000235 [Secundilactobacillus malefermentans]|uniref:Methyltransferase small domain-containing protein n=1 Tax=Secundilactobacillus malefermentans TaxID=176292 RepID=A0A4R5NNQ6_9LACO|nr:class I SAM-dependent methyltransferase [Secundilactobacillus malefermentans]KRM58414.1 16S RNA methylase [Secundilactobacillus malefermentans DSM 5705 = KCTC 3548]TDG77841.1 hypothetical protein C5L31_000235 [Secundilactobacillus malefermentans]
MTDHYYSHNPDVAHEEKHFEFTLLGNVLKFVTDNGVFSKRTIDFGSRVLIDNATLADLPKGDILDLGTGYGPIGLSVAKKYTNRQIDMADVNERALHLAEMNASENNIKNVTIFTSDSYSQVTKKYAAILTNPPVRAGKQVVDDMLSGAYDHLVVGGHLNVVLQKKQGAPSAKKLMTEVFGNCEVIKKDKGYYILDSVKE